MSWCDGLVVPALDGVCYGLLLFVVGAGLTLCFGVANILNLAHGTMYALGAYLAAALGDGTWTGWAAATAAGVLAGAGAGAALAGLVTPVVGRGHLSQALLTFGLAMIGGDLLVAAWGSHDLPVNPPRAIDVPVSFAGHQYPAYRLVFIAVAAVLAGALYLVVSRTRAGAITRAAVDDHQMLACLGVDPARVRLGVLIASGGLAGLAGALGAPIIGPGPSTAKTVLLLSLVVVVLGGLGSVGASASGPAERAASGSIGGVVLAAIAVGQTQTLGIAALPSVAPFLLFAAMAAVLAGRARIASRAGRAL